MTRKRAAQIAAMTGQTFTLPPGIFNRGERAVVMGAYNRTGSCVLVTVPRCGVNLKVKTDRAAAAIASEAL